jgi:hypothetical protein
MDERAWLVAFEEALERTAIREDRSNPRVRSMTPEELKAASRM